MASDLDEFFSQCDDTDADPTYVLESVYSSSDNEHVCNRKKRLKNRSFRNRCLARKTYATRIKSVAVREQVKEECDKKVIKSDSCRILHSQTALIRKSDSLASSRPVTPVSNADSGVFTGSEISSVTGEYCEMASVSNRDSSNAQSTRTLLNSGKLLSLYNNQMLSRKVDIQKLDMLNINIDWDVPIYQQRLNSRNDELFHITMQENGLMESISWTKEEDDTIIANWKSFKSEYGFDNPRIFFHGETKCSVFPHAKRRQFAQYIAKGLVNKRLRSVYRRFKTLLSPFCKKGRFTFLEDKVIMEIMNHRSKEEKIVRGQKSESTRILECLLQRSHREIHARYKMLELSSNIDYTINWSKKKCAMIVKELLQVCQIDTVDELLTHDIDKMEWEQVASSLGFCKNRLKALWLNKLSAQLSVKRPIYRNRLREKMICWLYERRHSFKDTNDIDWIRFCKHVKVRSPWFVFQKLRKMLITYVPQQKLVDFKGSIKHLHKHFLPVLQSGMLKDYLLTRLQYEDGVLKEIRATDSD